MSADVKGGGTASELIGAAVSRGVGIGMVIAAGIVSDMDEVKAEEILQACGLTTAAEMRAAGVDDYDIGILKPVITAIAQRKKNQGRAKAEGPSS